MKTEITIPVAELKSVLPGLGKVIHKSVSLPVLRCVKVSLDAAQTVRLQVNNLDEIVTATLGQCSTGTAGEILVPFDDLASLAKKCAATESVCLIGAAQETVVRYRAAGTDIEKPLKRFELSEWPTCHHPEAEPISLDDAFKRALKEAFECASTDSSRYILNGACLDVANKEAHYVVGTDGRHLYAANSFLFDIAAPLVIPTRKFLTWPGFVEDGGWRLRYEAGKDGNAWLQIDSDHWSYVTRSIEGNYPNWKEVMGTPDVKWTRVMLAEASVKTILEALPLLPGSEDREQPVTLEVQLDQLILKARANAKVDWSRVVVPEVKITGKPVEIELNRCYVDKALRFGATWIEILDPSKPLLFSSKGKTLAVAPLKDTVASAQNTSEQSPAAPPSAAAEPTPTEPERKVTMPETTMTSPRRGNLTGKPEPEGSVIDEVMKQIETLKTGLRKVLEDIGEVDRLLRRAAREQKASDKEIGKARSALRALQSVEI